MNGVSGKKLSNRNQIRSLIVSRPYGVPLGTVDLSSLSNICD